MDRSFVCEQIYQNPQGVFRLADVTTDQQALVKAYKESADLIYLDPPFYTNQRYAVKQRVGTAGYLGNRDYVLSVENDFDTFSSAEAYMDYLRTLLTTAHAILKKNGSIYIHVDFRAAYMVRGIADEIFGERNLLNEIVWHYKSGGRAKKFYSRKHDTIFFYKKRHQPYFDPDAVGMRRGEERRNNMKKGVDEDGRVYYSIRSAGKEYRYYADSVIYPDDVWSDISHLQQKDPERTGYPTQKPLALLRRIIRASCPENGLVADLCAGSGTTAVAAAMEGRRYCVVDKSPVSLSHTRSRLMSGGFGFHIQGETEWGDPAQLGYQLGQSGEELVLSLSHYAISGYENPFRLADYGTTAQLSLESCGMVPQGPSDISLVSFAGLGRLVDGTLSLQSSMVRSAKYPMFQELLRLGPGPGQPCLVIGDVFGNQRAYLV